MAKGAKSKTLDFSNVKDRGNIVPTHRPEGDYLGKVLSVTDITMGEEKRDAWLYIVKIGAGTYPYRCGFNDNELWKIRNLHVAAGVAIPKARQAIDPNKPVGKDIGITLQDHEYNDKLSSEIAAVFPPSELDGADGEAVADDEEGEDIEAEDEDEAPVKPKKNKGKKSKKMESLDIDEL
jgi:hypothetical protein